MAGVVSEEKVMVLDVVSSGVKRPINWLMMEVLAVPGPPTSRDTWLENSYYLCLLVPELATKAVFKFIRCSSVAPHALPHTLGMHCHTTGLL